MLYVSGGAASAKKPDQVLDILYVFTHGQITQCFKQDHMLHEMRTLILIIFRFKLLYDIIGSSLEFKLVKVLTVVWTKR